MNREGVKYEVFITLPGKTGIIKNVLSFLSFLRALCAWFVLVKYFYKALLLVIEILSAAPYPTLV